MIKIPIDEAGAFDFMAILIVKERNGLNVSNNLLKLSSYIQFQIGESEFLSICDSQEWRNLIASNMVMWQIQEAAMRDECKASDVDRANQVRYHAKQALQKKFFGGELTEQKSVRPYEQEAAK